jgi:hypothetical protein
MGKAAVEEVEAAVETPNARNMSCLLTKATGSKPRREAKPAAVGRVIPEGLPKASGAHVGIP